VYLNALEFLEEERDAWEAHVDETLRRLREAAESVRARGKQREAS